MRRIIVKDAEAYVDDVHRYSVDVAPLKGLGITFIGEDEQGWWFERTPFRGQERDNSLHQEVIKAIFDEAERKHQEVMAQQAAEASPVPTMVSAFQAYAALEAAGLLDAVKAYMERPDTPQIERLAFEKARDFKRDSPTLAKLAAVLGLSEAQLDDLFIQASKIEA